MFAWRNRKKNQQEKKIECEQKPYGHIICASKNTKQCYAVQKFRKFIYISHIIHISGRIVIELKGQQQQQQQQKREKERNSEEYDDEQQKI